MTGKKKQLDFTVRPRAAREELPPDADNWVRSGQTAAPEEGPQKRLTLNVPAPLHAAFKSRCAIEGQTIQEKVRFLIERELTPAAETAEQTLPDS